ncbi:6-phosphogluconate dehydrogenase [Glycocaulis alkaliphilus]|uniref:6-phosphogluconate dehydrogenase n=1 Tax=Glycocaulis alkaliphilus TaxID=1434191 RepID=A0A3T0EAA8_9PROT|nr:NAD(P)-dependent oxidoreductase [Glycocaulis alkaliphilus]AZU04210.1 6-phosphogluconate dehydrogenase [Glycocaulis alkaliphilus]GGB76702.1 dehydrogenase [Glycocaulis alkaliphilus]
MACAAFLGLGVMGFPMAGHLKAAGHEVRVWNRTAAKAKAWADQHAGTASSSPEEAADGADIVFMCLGDDPDVRAIALPLLEHMKPGSVLVDHTTASAQLARELHAAASARGIGFVDAPVSGGQAGAENGQLSIMCGGDADAFAKAEPVMQACAKAIVHAGPAGAGQLTKMVNQICIAGLVQGLSEGIHFAQAAGLDVETVISAVSKGAAQSWQMENRWQTMDQGKFDFGFAVEWMRKDLRIALEEARANGAKLPVTALVDQFYGEVEAMGGKRWDTSSLIARLNRE